MLKKITRKLAWLIAIIILGGFGGILADRYLFPYLATTRLFSRYNFLKKTTEEVTVINKTEQVFVKEDNSISQISNQVSSSVVNIISFAEPTTAESLQKTRNTTGLIVTSDGLIMSYFGSPDPVNTQYKVMTADGQEHRAEFVGLDSYSNLAFLKIDASNLSAIALGNSDDAKPGEKVVAVGNSYGSYSNIFAAGLLSEFDPTFNLSGKTVSSSEKLEGIFRTDFNSQERLIGGPIVDYGGQTIGIVGSLTKDNTVTYFLIPANKAKRVIDRAIKKELDQNPVLGVYYLPMTRTYAVTHNLSIDRGALIYSPSGQAGLAFIAGSVGQKAGLQLNDIIISINGQDIDLQNTLADTLYQFKQGEEITVKFIRNKEDRELKIGL